MKFLMNKTNGLNEKPSPISLGSVFKWLIGIAIILIIVGFAGFQIAKIANNWNEYVFAYQNPDIVKAVRMDYQNQQEKIKSSFLNRQQTPQDKLLNAVSDQLKTSK